MISSIRERSLIMTWRGRQIRGGVIIFWGIPIGGHFFLGIPIGGSLFLGYWFSEWNASEFSNFFAPSAQSYHYKTPNFAATGAAIH